MNPLPRLLRLKPENVLASGRAPSCWKQEVEKATTTAGRLERACAWMQTLHPKTKLRPGPLLGTCLAELMGEPPASEDSAPPRRILEQPRTRPPHTPGEGTESFHFPQKPFSDDIVRAPGHPAIDFASHNYASPPKFTGAKKSPASMSQKASPHLLAKMAGFHASVDASPSKVVQMPKPEKNRVSPVEANGKYQDWLSQAAARTRQRLSKNVSRLSTPRPDVPPWSEYPSQPSVEAPAPPPTLARNTPSPRIAHAQKHPHEQEETPSQKATPSSLEAQWQQPLNGQTIPQENLDAYRLRRQSRGLVGAQRSRASRSVHPPLMNQVNGLLEQTIGNALTSSKPATEPNTREKTNLPTQNSFPSREGAMSLVAPPQRHFSHDLHPASTSADEMDNASEWEEEETYSRFAPPQLATQMPALKPLRPSHPFAQPIASVTAERNARREATAPEDLDELSRKIKQILDEESRRHGIDV